MFRFFHSGTLTKSEQRLLLKHARNCIEAKMHGKKGSKFSESTPRLDEERGAFVTLIKDDNLRGCVGLAQSTQPLYRTVQDMAITAAFEDPRFPPMEQAELADTVIEISAVSWIRELTSVRKIKIRRHGLMIKLKDAKGLLLPQVAARNNWDRLTFLENVCIKAGLKKDDWKNPAAKMMIFAAQVFSDSYHRR